MPHTASDALLEGYRRFRLERWPDARADYEALAETGQKPHTLIVACSDSRADPALIFDAKPGELFVVRNVANLVPPYEPDGGLHGVSAALEFGVKVLEVSRIVVMGHARCGGVAAMVGGAPESCRDFVEPWVAQALPVARAAAAAAPEDRAQSSAEESVVLHSLANLRTFPWIAEREADSRLTLSGLHFGIGDGVLRVLGKAGNFKPLA